MGKFLKSVRRGDVMSPLRLGFDLKTWLEEGQKRAEGDLTDLQLALSGILFDKKLKRVWERFSNLTLDKYSGVHLRRAYVALANRDFATLRGKMESKLQEFAAQTTPYVEEMLSTKVNGALNGCDYSIDDLITSGVDGLHMPLRKTFAAAGRDSKLDLEDLRQAILLGQIQWFVTTVWEDCVWSGFRVGIHEGAIVSVPDDSERARALAVGYARYVARVSEMTQHGFNVWRNMPSHLRALINRRRRVVRVSGSGSRMKFDADIAEIDPHVPIQSFTLRMVATELYFEDLFQCQLPKLKGVTPDLLLSAWELLYSLSEALVSEMSNESSITNPRDLLQFAPAIPRTKLCDLLAKGLEIPFRLAKDIIEFLTFSEQHSDELWARPFVELDGSTLVPVLTCLHSPNSLRMIEKWMKYGGLNLQERGEAFEVHVRKQVKQTLGTSRLIKSAGVCEHRYKLKFEGDNPGDIDLIIWFGSTILIGEVKCNLFPAKASEFYNYFGDLEKAGQQIARKAIAFGGQTENFWRRIAKCEPPSETKVVPFILSNLPLGVGLRFSDVPVTDLLILERFFGDGFLERFVVFDPKLGNQGGQKLAFYATAAEAERVVDTYLSDPPQLHHFTEGLAPVQNVLPSVDEDDAPWAVFDYEVQFDRAKIDSLRVPPAEHLSE